MLSVIAEEKKNTPEGKVGFKIVFLYTVRNSVDSDGRSEDILFLSRLREIFGILGEEGDFRLFVTGEEGNEGGLGVDSKSLRVQRRRIEESDLKDALGESERREGTVVYVCGVPGMTDRFVELAGKAEGMDEKRVLSEKWW